MPQFTILPATPEDTPLLAEMAAEIWREHYTPIIGAEQVAYMVAHFQSAEAMKQQMETENYRYFFLDWDGAHAGYTGIQADGGALYLSKLYVNAAFRGNGIAKSAMAFLTALCQKEGIKKMWLTVNKFNSGAIASYEAMGMTRTRSQIADIGGGYVMDDYIYEIEI